ncbi:zinc-ribbon domain-containing protein [Chloroflexota bacterium]
MTIFVALLLTVLTFAFVIYPFFKRRVPSLEPEADETLRELTSQRDTTYSMLKELEFDFQSGVLTEADYRDLEARYKKKALPILKGMDDLKKGTAIEDEIEEQVRALRCNKTRFCPKCGAETQEDDSFCSHCGAGLKREG